MAKSVGMRRPSLFEQKWGESLQKATAAEALEILRGDARVEGRVQERLDQYDAEQEANPHPGRSRVQVFVDALKEAVEVFEPTPVTPEG
jgi:hypothetical protein